MRVLIFGGRDFCNPMKFHWLMQQYVIGVASVVIHGDGSGADLMAKLWAKENDMPSIMFRADWKSHGNFGGPMRNERMLCEGMPHYAIALPGGHGTWDMKQRCAAHRIVVLEK